MTLTNDNFALNLSSTYIHTIYLPRIMTSAKAVRASEVRLTATTLLLSREGAFKEPVGRVCGHGEGRNVHL